MRACVRMQAMENTNMKDYVTEKLWQAFEAGCVPIYWGPPNVADVLPDPGGVGCGRDSRQLRCAAVHADISI